MVEPGYSDPSSSLVADQAAPRERDFPGTGSRSHFDVRSVSSDTYLLLMQYNSTMKEGSLTRSVNLSFAPSRSEL